jgi:transcriptional regulator with XRE-family HTH domain
MSWQQFKQELRKDKSYNNFLSQPDLKFQISEMIIEARTIKGLTQAELAEKAGTKQPSIARVENGSVLPSLKFLNKLAQAMGTQLIPPKFAFMSNYQAVKAKVEVSPNCQEQQEPGGQEFKQKLQPGKQVDEQASKQSEATWFQRTAFLLAGILLAYWFLEISLYFVRGVES